MSADVEHGSSLTQHDADPKLAKCASAAFEGKLAAAELWKAQRRNAEWRIRWLELRLQVLPLSLRKSDGLQRVHFHNAGIIHVSEQHE